MEETEVGKNHEKVSQTYSRYMVAMDHFYRDHSLYGRLGQSHFLGSCSDARYGFFLLRFRSIGIQLNRTKQSIG